MVNGASRMHLPEEFKRTIRATHHTQGEAWLERFPELIHFCETRWPLNILPPYDLSFNYVAPAEWRGGERVVVKLCQPDSQFRDEIDALEHSNQSGKAMVTLIDYDLEHGVLILEHLQPGRMLAEEQDDEAATVIAAKLLRNLWTEVPHDTNLPSTEGREASLAAILNQYPRGLGPVSRTMLEEAAAVFQQMNNTIKAPVLLHGDFHHYNVLCDQTRGWTVIDPKGLTGEKEYDVIQFLMNCLPEEGYEEVMERRIELLTNTLNLDKARLLKWGFCHAVLSTCWILEDGGDQHGEPFFKCIEVFKGLHQKMLG
ncbi:aminoglycoside phosphotransferase family protein [Thalassobacillus sp. CUG 92003]|uniref:aminoglycoside phosphotransferase family protein n=1 Tax=Thalassobacillus sp. CUG 92003 TaxID=2736641 RepID=UPI0015E6C85B|nr:aminoglycoside phosphotransferase family protein [Thalassobacillus sp. CUG 92003]